MARHKTSNGPIANGTLYPSAVATDQHCNPRDRLQPEGRWVAFKPILENFTDALTPLTVDIVRRVLPALRQFIDGRYYLDFDSLRRWVPLDVTDTELVELAAVEERAQRLSTQLVATQRSSLDSSLLAYVSTGLLWVRSRHLPFDHARRFQEALRRDTGATRTRRSRQSACTPARSASVRRSRPVSVPGERFRDALLLSARRPAVVSAPLRAALRSRADCAAVRRNTRHAVDAVDRSIAGRRRSSPNKRRRSASCCSPTGSRNCRTSSRYIRPPRRSWHHWKHSSRDYGHRGTREIELAAPRWQEDPTPLFVMIRNLLREGFTEPLSVQARDPQRPGRSSTRRRADGSYQTLRSRAGWSAASATTPRFAKTRATTRCSHSQPCDTKLLALEQQLLEQGALKCADDIFYLTWDEVIGTAAPHPTAPTLQSLIRRRRLTHMRRNRTQPPLTINVDYRPPQRGVGVLEASARARASQKAPYASSSIRRPMAKSKAARFWSRLTQTPPGRRCSSAPRRSSSKPAATFRTRARLRANWASRVSSTSPA